MGSKPKAAVVASRFLGGGYRAPVEDLQGVKTYESEKPSKGINDPSGDTTYHPPGESPKSDRDRARPESTDTKENLQKNMPGNWSFNTPGPSTDTGPNPKTDTPVRTPSVPGEEYGHPYKDNVYPRRTEAALYPSFGDRQKEQRGDAKRYYQKYYRKNKSKVKMRANRDYDKKKHQPSFKREKRLRQDPHYEDKFHRLPAGGVRSEAERSQDYRDKSTKKVADTFYRETFTPGYNMDPGPGARDLGSPSPRSPTNRHPDWEHTDRPPAESMNNIGPVYNNPGSAKVIPSGHGFVNKEAGFKKVAAKYEAILRGCDPQVEKGATSVSPRLAESTPEGFYRFTVAGDTDTYSVTVQGSEGDYRVACTCPYWRWQGPEHWAKVGGYLYGDPVGSATKPKVKDPRGSHRLCKHALATLRLVKTGRV